jgi:hypothetical protein
MTVGKPIKVVEVDESRRKSAYSVPFASMLMVSILLYGEASLGKYNSGQCF